jgi:hypothetical protein
MSDPTSGIRRTPSLGNDAVTPSDVDTIAESADASQPALPNWSDRESDERPGWTKAGMPKEEWLRAKATNDARIAKATPGSEEFAKLMEARLRMHFGSLPKVDFREISEFKKSVYREHLQGDLEAEIRQKEGPSRLPIRFAVGIGLLVLVVGILALIKFREARAPEPPPSPATPTTEQPTEKAPVVAPTNTAPDASAVAPPETPPSDAKVEPTPPPEPTPVKTPAKTVEPRPTAPTATATTPPAKPTATGEQPFFR